MNSDDLAVIVSAARTFGVDPDLVMAIVLQETGGSVWLTRFEPAWKFYNDPVKWAKLTGVTADTERVQQATSWGYGQTMGAVARDLGHEGLLTELLTPEVSAHYTCKKLKQCLDRYAYNESDAIAAYNAGSAIRRDGGAYINQQYVDGVMAKLAAQRRFS